MARGTLGGALTLLAGSGLWFSGDEQDLPVVRVNPDDKLMSYWPSEDYGAPLGMPPECRWWNFSVQYEATLCSHFAIGRLSSTPTRAMERALNCAGAHATECVLSPEVGLAMPAAFVYMHDRGESSMKMLLAPRVVETPDTTAAATQHVRVTPPDGDGVTDTRTFLFNRSVHVEYLDGSTRLMESTRLDGNAAYCVQLLRRAFEPGCWSKID